LTDARVLQTVRGQIVLRPEQSADADFLYALFRSHMLDELALMPVDAATKEHLVRMQFNSQTATYRAQFPQARFDIVEQDGSPIGRLIVDSDAAAGCIVDFALLPERRGAGLGTAILAAVLRDQRRPVLSKVLYNNEASLRMCRRVGFVQIGGELPFLQLEWRPPAETTEAPGGATAS
jgi:RimJ/RimL family protein N-acetyltransferase